MFCSLFLLSICVGMSWSAVTKQELAIPSYFYPGGNTANYWKMIEQASSVKVAIINPNSGPGETKDQNYANVLQSNVKAGHIVLCYVDTGYFGVSGRTTHKGETSASAWTTQIKQEVDKAYQLYGASGLSGIFLDDGLSDCGQQNKHVNFYKDIHDYIKNKHPGAFIVLNPGTGVEQCYASVADVLIVFEHDYQHYKTWTQPSWSQNQANGKQFWHLIYAAKSKAEMQDAIKLSKQRNAGLVYVTDDDLPNPWDTLPSQYWNDELRLASSN